MSSKFEIREALLDDAASIARVHLLSWQTSYRGLISQEYLDSLSLERRTSLRKELLKSRDGLKQVAVETQTRQIVGFCDVGKNREPHSQFNAELFAIYLLEGFKRLGIGQELFLRAARWVLNQEMRSLHLWVLTENTPARKFYEKMGGNLLPHSKKVLKIGLHEYDEVSYYWNDVRDLENLIK